MTQTLKKQDINIESGSDYYTKFYKEPNEVREIILNYLFRNISFSTRREKIRAVTINENKHISEDTGIPEFLVHRFISKCLVDIVVFKNFLRRNPTVLNFKDKLLMIKILLRKIYRLVPIFDLRRAIENARRLQERLGRLYFWPQVMTRVAVIIFITDLLDTQKDMRVIQSNLRVLCSCSAYAFHRTRNKIGLTSEYIKSL